MYRYLLIIALAAVLCRTPEAPAAASSARFDHSIELIVDIPGRTVSGTDTITPASGAGQVELYLREGSGVDAVTQAGEPVGFTTEAIKKERAKRISIKLPSPGAAFTVQFSGVFPDVRSARENIKRGVAFVEDGVIGPEGVLLPSSSLWYPKEYGRLHTARATVTIDAPYRTVMEGELARSAEEDGLRTEVWEVERPVDGLDLVAARFVVHQREHNSIKLYTFFFGDDPALSQKYMDKTAEYLDLYSEMIAPYPFKKFAVVENFLPTGYGMPSFTLLGSTVLRLPFIPDTSLGHEVAHSWWGNSVYADPAAGNWVEALTTYLSDHLYVSKKGEKEASRDRLQQVRGYANYAEEAAIALKDFNDATTPETRAVGYNKGMMVFSMLEDELGQAAFNDGLKRLYRDKAFSRASWDDIQAAFEAASGEPLGWFFDQWVERAGGPKLALDKVSVKGKEGAYETEFEIIQHNRRPYRLTLRAVVQTPGGGVVKKIIMKNALEKVKIESTEAPLAVTIDPEYRVFRLLWPEELPPSFGACFGDKHAVAVLPGEVKARERYAEAAASLARDFELEIATDAEAGVRDFIGSSTLLIFGSPDENRVARLAGGQLAGHLQIKDQTLTIEGREYPLSGTVAAMSTRNGADPAKSICFFISGAGPQQTLRAAQRLRYFSRYGFVVFPGGDKVDKGRFKGKNILHHELSR